MIVNSPGGAGLGLCRTPLSDRAERAEMERNYLSPERPGKQTHLNNILARLVLLNNRMVSINLRVEEMLDRAYGPTPGANGTDDPQNALHPSGFVQINMALESIIQQIDRYENIAGRLSDIA